MSRADSPRRDGCYSNDYHVIIITHATHGPQDLKHDNQSGFILFQLLRANVPKMHSDPRKDRHWRLFPKQLMRPCKFHPLKPTPSPSPHPQLADGIRKWGLWGQIKHEG